MEIHEILIAFEMCSFIALPRISSGGRVASPGKDSMPQVAQLLSTQVCGMLSGQLSPQREHHGAQKEGVGKGALHISQFLCQAKKYRQLCPQGMRKALRQNYVASSAKSTGVQTDSSLL